MCGTVATVPHIHVLSLQRPPLCSFLGHIRPSGGLGIVVALGIKSLTFRTRLSISFRPTSSTSSPSRTSMSDRHITIIFFCRDNNHVGAELPVLRAASPVLGELLQNAVFLHQTDPNHSLDILVAIQEHSHVVGKLVNDCIEGNRSPRHDTHLTAALHIALSLSPEFEAQDVVQEAMARLTFVESLHHFKNALETGHIALLDILLNSTHGTLLRGFDQSARNTYQLCLSGTSPLLPQSVIRSLYSGECKCSTVPLPSRDDPSTVRQVWVKEYMSHVLRRVLQREPLSSVLLDSDALGQAWRAGARDCGICKDIFYMDQDRNIRLTHKARPFEQFITAIDYALRGEVAKKWEIMYYASVQRHHCDERRFVS
ncbi:hypothetical protein OF83DRAFT_294743 [Amylostereum chailletii]|nr:hypothetical protein OF83DRAFT_294743 [Amylostereum chailletii]